MECKFGYPASGKGKFTEWLRLEGTSRGPLVPPLCSSMATHSWLFWTTWILSISKDGDYSLSGKPVPVLSHLQSKNVLPGLQMVLPMFWEPLKRVWLSHLCTFTSGTGIN